MKEILLNVRMVCEKLPRAFVDVVAALCDGKRDDARGRRSHLFDGCFAVLRRPEIAGHRADDASGLLRRAALDHGVEKVLPAQHIPHAEVALKNADAGLAPAFGVGKREQIVQVDRLVCAMEAAYPQVNRMIQQIAAVVSGCAHLAVETGQRPFVQWNTGHFFRHFFAPRTIADLSVTWRVVETEGSAEAPAQSSQRRAGRMGQARSLPARRGECGFHRLP